MTYCLAIKLDSGLVFASDSRTNAGIDNISLFCKTHVFSLSGVMELVVLNSGNLATTQEIISSLKQDIENKQEGNLYTLESMFDVAKTIGALTRKVIERHSRRDNSIDFNCSLLVGGQIKGGPQKLFMIYPAGNFIEATPETPFFQIGELKYGKPMLDRTIHYNSSVDDAIKCAVVSFDATIRSNLSVGLPIKISYLPENKDSESIPSVKSYTIEEGDETFNRICKQWKEGLRNVFQSIEAPQWWN